MEKEAVADNETTSAKDVEQRLIGVKKMYKSIIDIIHTDMEIKMEGEIMKAVQRCNIEVDKEELLKALQYDRGQYDKGYQDGLNADKWIPCEVELPKKRGNYLVCSKGVTWVANWFLDTWWGIEKRCRYSDVEAWMPLPVPYKKEGAE